jgi:hypothetical protein
MALPPIITADVGAEPVLERLRVVQRRQATRSKKRARSKWPSTWLWPWSEPNTGASGRRRRAAELRDQLPERPVERAVALARARRERTVVVRVLVDLQRGLET